MTKMSDLKKSKQVLFLKQLMRNGVIFFLLFGFASLLFSEEVKEPRSFSLQECMDYALEKNPNLLRIKESLVKNKGLIVQARSGALPQATVSTKLQTEDKGRFGEPFGPPQNEDSWGVSLRVTQTVYAGGKQNAAIESARFTEQSLLQEVQGTIDELILNIRKNYYLAMWQRDLRMVSEKSIELLQEEVDQQRKKLSAGTATKFHVLRAEVELANARPALIRAKNQYRIAISELTKLMGYSMPRNLRELPFEISGNFQDQSPELEVDRLMERSLQYRPELKSLQYQIKAKEKRLKVDRAGLLPNLSIFGGYDWFSDTRQKELNQINEGYVAGFQGEWSVFDGFESKAKMDQTRSEMRQLQLQWEDQKSAIEVQIHRGYSDYLEASELLLSQQKNVESAEESLRLAKVRERAGTGLQLDILSSQVALTQARTNELQAHYDLSVSLSELERFTGIPMKVTISDHEDRLPVSSAPKNLPETGNLKIVEFQEPTKAVELYQEKESTDTIEPSVRRAEPMVSTARKPSSLPF